MQINVTLTPIISQVHMNCVTRKEQKMMWNWPLCGMKNEEQGKEVNMILDPFVLTPLFDIFDYLSIQRENNICCCCNA